jgi:hypothetical protein
MAGPSPTKISSARICLAAERWQKLDTTYAFFGSQARVGACEMPTKTEEAVPVTTIYTTKTDELVARDARVLGDVLKVRFYPLAVGSQEGCTITDVDGNRFLDFMAGWAVANTGYGNQEVLQPVI